MVVSGSRAVPFGLATERSGTEIWGITALPRSMAFGIADSAKEMESNAARIVVSTISSWSRKEKWGEF